MFPPSLESTYQLSSKGTSTTVPIPVPEPSTSLGPAKVWNANDI